MKKIEVIDYSSSVVDFIANALNKYKDISNMLVVFPNIRPGYYLRRKIFETKKQETLLCEILSIDDFVKKFLLEKEIFESIDKIDMVSMLYKNFHKEISELFSRNISLDEFWGWGNIIINDFEELKINGIGSDEIKVYDFLIKDGIKPKSACLKLKEYERFSTLYGNFYEFLKSHKKYSRALIYERLSKRLKEINFGYEKMIFAGFFAFNKIEKNIFSFLHSLPYSHFVFMAHELLKEKISFLGSDIKVMSEIKIPVLNVRRTLNKHHELFSLKNRLKKDSSSTNYLEFESDSAIVIPDSSMILPIMENLLPEVKKFNISAGFSSKFSPLYHFIEILKEVIDRGIYENEVTRYLNSSYLKLISHPYIRAIKNIGESIFILNERFSLVFSGFVSLDEIEKIEEKTKEFNEKVLRPFEKIESVGDFFKKISEVLDYIIKNSKLSFHPYWKPVFDITVIELLDMRKKEVALLKFNNKKSYFSLLELIFDKIEVPFIGSPIEGLQCIGFLESRGLKFKNLYILDMSDGIIPPKTRNFAFISDYIKKKLGISDSKLNMDVYRYYFETLISMSSNVWIFHTDNDKNTRSPLLERLVWFCEKKGIEISDDIERIPSISFKLNQPQKIHKTEEVRKNIKEMTFSASSIETYIECEIKFYYKYVLGLGRFENIDDPLDPADYGKIVHLAIEKIFSRFDEISIKKDREFKKNLVACVDESVKKYVDENSVDSYFIKKQIKKRMCSLYDYFQKNFDGYNILSCEKKSDTTLKIKDGVEVKITAKADMIVEKKGNCIVIDFKTSSNENEYLPKFKKLEKGEYKKIKSVQLPLYIMVFSKIYSSISNALLITLGSKEIVGYLCYDEKNQFSSYQKKMEEAILDIIADMIEKDFFETNITSKSKCNYCEFKKICWF